MRAWGGDPQVRSVAAAATIRGKGNGGGLDVAPVTLVMAASLIAGVPIPAIIS